jgi:hypothetical protein
MAAAEAVMVMGAPIMQLNDTAEDGSQSSHVTNLPLNPAFFGASQSF